LELGALASLAYWGSQATTSTGANVALAVATPVAAAAMWGRFAAPRSTRRLGRVARLVPEALLFGGATAALATARSGTVALVFGVVAALNTAAVHAWRIEG
jgi:hypothetical protein